MASYTLMDVFETFPGGTVVGAYEAANWRTAGLPPSGAPQGSAAVTASVDSGGEVAFTGLTDDTGYFAAAQVSGTWRYMGFRTPALSLESVESTQVLLGAPSGDVTGAADTAAILAAFATAEARYLAAGTRVTVKAAAGANYNVTISGTRMVQHASGSALASRDVCCPIPNGVLFDANGSLFKLRGGAQAMMFCSDALDSLSRNVDYGLINAVVDGNDVAATTHAMMMFAYSDRMTLKRVKVQNGQYYGILAWAITDSDFDEVRGEDFIGQPLTFGDPQLGAGGLNHIYDSRLGRIGATDVTTMGTVSQPGNSFAGTFTRCTIDSIYARRCDAAIKLQAPGEDTAIGIVIVDDCGEPVANSGLKLQGVVGGAIIKRHTVAQVVALRQWGSGLYLYATEDCSIGQYAGYGNGRDGASPDVWVSGTRDHIGKLSSTNAGQDAVNIRATAVAYDLANVRVRNPGQVGAAVSKVGVDVAGGSGEFGSVVVNDDQGTKTMTYGLRQTNATATFTVRRFESSGAITAPYLLSGSNQRIQRLVTGPPTTAEIVSNAEAAPASTDTMAPQLPALVLPVHGVLLPTASQTFVVNRMCLVRVIVPRSGFLRDVTMFVTAQSGNCIIAAFDAGAAASAVYTALGNSGSVAVGAANAWQTWDPGAAAIAVTQGQQLMLAVIFDNTTAGIGRGSVAINSNAALLPTGYLPGSGTLPKMSAIRDVGSFSVPASIAEANALVNNASFVLFARVSS